MNKFKAPSTMTAVDYFAQHKPIRLRKPNHVDRDQGIVCEVYFVKTHWMWSQCTMVFAFKNTNERPVRISMEFFLMALKHKVVPADSLKSKRVEPEGVLEMCRVQRHHFVKKWLPICRYRWTFTFVPLIEESNSSNAQELL